jgi:hypothetical protein
VLIEGNHWGDHYWGAVPAPKAPPGLPAWQIGGYASGWLCGHNWLGRLIMMVRDVMTP